MDILKMTKEDCEGLTDKVIVPYMFGKRQNGEENVASHEVHCKTPVKTKVKCRKGKNRTKMIAGLNGIVRKGGREQKNYIRQSIKDYKLDFVGIQETMRQDYPTILKEISGGYEFHWDGIPARGRSGGILLGVNKETYDLVEKPMGTYYVRFLVASKKDNFTWNLVVVYGDAQ
jgi:hypothetical protein